MKLEDFKNSYMGIRIEDIDLGLILGNQYIIENIAQRRKKDRSKYFRGTFIQETDYFYVFRSRAKYCECFLKVDFAINNLTIKEYISKAS
ncbi:MAG: hypothetical protein M0Q14_04665 [Tissierellaceae bacterium]|nr:hypothetical protein [Tissierellaceae bacterium]